MKFLSILSSSIFQILSFIFVLGYLLGFLNLHFSDKTNYCVMTYMFEYPQFVRLSVPENKIYPQYGLYAYSEGRFTEKARKMWFDGVPVLFLPGNSGSHMQARSLASVALRKALTKGYQYHFDFFTVSYNEELSGLYGGVLQSQTRFASACISKILSLYKSNKYTKTVPTSIILIGHSMGGLIAKRLLAYPSTINTTSVAITLAAPLEAPVVNVDAAMDDYYMLMNLEWNKYINNDPEMKEKKMLISFGNGPRDVLMPSGLTSSNDSYINALTTSVPGVWASPDHVCIVWCKQLVMVINRYLFSIVNPVTEQVVEDSQILKARATQFFKANRSMILSPDIPRANVTMLADAFWYEDNRRIYQITRPNIDKTTYLMIRLVAFPQNRFVAIEAVNLEDRDWVFGCNAKYTYNTYRHCKDATSLSELSRWTGAATDFGKRKLATINLHKIKEMHPDWSHVVVKVSPTRKPIMLNVDVNDHASRVIDIDLLYFWSVGKYLIVPETEQDSLYYEFNLKGFNTLHQAYLFYVEPTKSCRTQYHVSAELHVPWAENHEYYHYYTHMKQSPMKLRLFKTNPNVTDGYEVTEYAKITLLLDPQCTYTISISASWYHRLAQFARNYSPVLVPYMTAIVLLAARSNILELRGKGACVSLHSALMSEGVKPYYALLYARLGALIFFSIPAFSFIFENASWNNLELRYFIKSMLVLPAYLTALGIMQIATAAVVAVMVFSSQIAHRLFFRIMWRGGTGLAEKVAAGLQKVPMVVSAGLLCAAPLSCGAASLVAGAAFYAFMLSKMYEEYLEDYVYKLMAKIFARVCRIFRSKKANKESETEPLKRSSSTEKVTSTENDNNKKNVKENKDSSDDKKKESQTTGVASDGKKKDDETTVNSNKNKDETKTTDKTDKIKTDTKTTDKSDEKKDDTSTTDNSNKKKDGSKVNDEASEKTCDDDKNDKHLEVDEDLSSLNFHMMMFSMWLAVTLVNVPALLTWARNFSYSMVLKPDTSYHTGLIMSACSTCVWQMNLPRRNLRHYESVAALLFTMAVFLLALGPLSLTIVNYGVTFMFAVITLQQVFDKEEKIPTNDKGQNTDAPNNGEHEDDAFKQFQDTEGIQGPDLKLDDCVVCSSSKMYRIFKNIKEKFNTTENL